MAHSLRGAAANIGAETLTYACAAIETSDGSDDAALLSDLTASWPPGEHSPLLPDHLTASKGYGRSHE